MAPRNTHFVRAAMGTAGGCVPYPGPMACPRALTPEAEDRISRAKPEHVVERRRANRSISDRPPGAR
eukprot:4817421-Prymnesium_polylepis.1